MTPPTGTWYWDWGLPSERRLAALGLLNHERQLVSRAVPATLKGGARVEQSEAQHSR